MKVYAEMNIALQEVVLGYELWPHQATTPTTTGSPQAVDWKPRFSEREICEGPDETKCRRETREEVVRWRAIKYGTMSRDGRVGIFLSAFKDARKNIPALMRAGPDRVALGILHETIHWIDRVSTGGRMTPHQAQMSEHRAYKAQADYARTFGPGVVPQIFIDDREAEADRRLKIAKMIPEHLTSLPHLRREAIEAKYGIFDSEPFIDDNVQIEHAELGSPEDIKSAADVAFFSKARERSKELSSQIQAAQKQAQIRRDEERRQRDEHRRQKKNVDPKPSVASPPPAVAPPKPRIVAHHSIQQSALENIAREACRDGGGITHSELKALWWFPGGDKLQTSHLSGCAKALLLELSKLNQNGSGPAYTLDVRWLNRRAAQLAQEHAPSPNTLPNPNGPDSREYEKPGCIWSDELGTWICPKN